MARRCRSASTTLSSGVSVVVRAGGLSAAPLDVPSTVRAVIEFARTYCGGGAAGGSGVMDLSRRGGGARPAAKRRAEAGPGGGATAAAAEDVGGGGGAEDFTPLDELPEFGTVHVVARVTAVTVNSGAGGMYMDRGGRARAVVQAELCDAPAGPRTTLVLWDAFAGEEALAALRGAASAGEELPHAAVVARGCEVRYSALHDCVTLHTTSRSSVELVPLRSPRGALLAQRWVAGARSLSGPASWPGEGDPGGAAAARGAVAAPAPGRRFPRVSVETVTEVLALRCDARVAVVARAVGLFVPSLAGAPRGGDVEGGVLARLVRRACGGACGDRACGCPWAFAPIFAHFTSAPPPVPVAAAASAALAGAACAGDAAGFHGSAPCAGGDAAGVLCAPLAPAAAYRLLCGTDAADVGRRAVPAARVARLLSAAMDAFTPSSRALPLALEVLVEAPGLPPRPRALTRTVVSLSVCV